MDQTFQSPFSAFRMPGKSLHLKVGDYVVVDLDAPENPGATGYVKRLYHYGKRHWRAALEDGWCYPASWLIKVPIELDHATVLHREKGIFSVSTAKLPPSPAKGMRTQPRQQKRHRAHHVPAPIYHSGHRIGL